MEKTTKDFHRIFRKVGVLARAANSLEPKFGRVCARGAANLDLFMAISEPEALARNAESPVLASFGLPQNVLASLILYHE